MSKKVLLFEDENSIAENLAYVFATDGYQFSHATTANEGLEIFRQAGADLILLDVGLPDKDGFYVCQKIRETSTVPIFFLTARSEEVDRVIGLEIGADDYITKPFSPRELAARVKAFFRRFDGEKEALPKKSSEFQVLDEKFQIHFQGHDLQLRRYEFGLLKVLLNAPGRVYSRNQLMDAVWESPDMSLSRTVDTHIKVIRSQIKKWSEKEWIITHRGLGYSLAEKE